MDIGMSALFGGKRPVQITGYDDSLASKRRHIEPPEVNHRPAVPVQYPERETLFVNSDDQVEALLNHFQQQSGNRVTLISNPDDLEQGGLCKRISIGDDGSLFERPGQLVESQDNSKVTLVIDFRQFESSQLNSLKSLFDTPPTWHRLELGGHVRVISLVSKDLFSGCGNGKAGNDFYQRVAQGFQAGSALGQQLNAWSGGSPVQALLNDQVPATGVLSGPGVRTIDLSCGNWQEVLFGFADVDERGRRYYRLGQLAGVEPGETLVVKGAPWHDRGFRHSLYTILRSGQYYANGNYQTLPGNIAWRHRSVTADDIQQLKKCVKWVNQPDPKQAIINSDNLALVLGKNRVNEHGLLVRHDHFSEYLRGCSGIRITSPLTIPQWTTLLRAVQTAGIKSVPVYLDIPQLQPLPFQGPEPDTGNTKDNRAFFQPAPPIQSRCITLIQGDDTALRDNLSPGAGPMDTSTSSDSPVLNIVVTQDLSLTRLLEHLRLVSLTEARFQRQDQPFVEALRTGRIIRIRGLESNRILARQLESLLASPPTLIINGQRETFDNCRLEVYWPANVLPESVLWRQALAVTEQQLEISRKQLELWLKNTLRVHDTGIINCIERLCYLINSRVPANERLLLNRDLLSKLVRQAEQERWWTGEQQLSAHHWCKAMHSVLLKRYRYDRELYGFLKLAVRGWLPELEWSWVDTTALQGWLRQHPNPDIPTLQRHFWSLTRCLGCPMIDQLPGKMEPGQSLLIAADSEPFQLLARQLVRAAGLLKHDPLFSAVDCQALQARLGLQPHQPQWEQDRFYPRSLGIEKQVQDFYYQLGLHRPRKEIRDLAGIVAFVMVTQQSAQEKELELTRNLTLHRIPSESVKLMAKLLLDPDNPKHWQHWYTRRKARLKAKVETNPVTLVTGDSGSGKSFMATEVAKTLQGGGPVQVISCQPQTRLSELMIEETLEQSPVTGEAEIIQKAGPLRQWADKKASREQPAVLVIHRANLCDPAVWDCLQGVYEQKPYITDQNGHPIPITQHHHIIMTGSPLSTAGGRVNTRLRARAPELLFRPLNNPFMASQIVRPALESVLNQLQQQGFLFNQDGMQAQLNTAVMELFNRYQMLVPDHRFRAGDLTDFSSRLLTYFRDAVESGLQDCLFMEQQDEQLLKASLLGLIWQVMEDSLAGGTGMGYQLQALKAWYGASFSLYSTLAAPYRMKFGSFVNEWQLQQLWQYRQQGRESHLDDLNLDNQSVKEQVRTIWLELDRLASYRSDDTPDTADSRCMANNTNSFQGHWVTVIEDPAGRGKGDLVKQLVHEWNRQQQRQGKTSIPIRSVTLDPNQPDKFYHTLAQASRLGEIVVAADISLLDSPHHEGAINDLLTRGSKPGFHLFITVNSVTVSERHRLSNTLKSRCNHIVIGDYDYEDLEHIAGTLFPCDPQLAKNVVQWHWQLKRVLKSQSISLYPTVKELKELAKIFSTPLPVHGDEQVVAMEVDSVQTEKDNQQKLQQQFEQTYGFYLQLLSSEANPQPSLDDIQQWAGQSLPVLQNTSRTLRRWTDWLHQQLPARQFSALLTTWPISVIAGPQSCYNAASGVLTLRQSLLDGDLATQDQQIKQEIIRTLMCELWQRHLPLKSPYDHDILFSAAYHSWQQATAKVWFAEQPGWAEFADQVFPLSQEERETLALINNENYLDTLGQLAGLEPSEYSLAAFEQAFFTGSALLDPGHQPDKSGIERQQAIAQQITAIEKSMRFIEPTALPPVQSHRVASYTKPQSGAINIPRYFKKTGVTNIREGICNATIKEGCICLESAPRGSRGYEVILPARKIPENMAHEEDHGAFYLTVKGGQERQWQAIFGIAPQQKLYALTTNPAVELEVIRDRATHLHYVRAKGVPQLGESQEYQVEVGIRKQPFTALNSPVYKGDVVFGSASLTEALAPAFAQDAEFQWLRDLKNQNIHYQLYLLESWYKGFSAAPESASADSRPLKVEDLLQQLRHRYGDCTHRALGFQAMATWLEIPARIVTGPDYTSVEAAKDNGNSWQAYDLGNHSHSGSTVKSLSIPFTATKTGFTTNAQVRSAIIALSREGQAVLANLLEIDVQQLETWISSGGSTTIAVGTTDRCSGYWHNLKTSAAVAQQVFNKIINQVCASGDQTTSRELLELAIRLYPLTYHGARCGPSYRTLQRIAQTAVRVSGADYCPIDLLCQALAEFAESANNREARIAFEQDLMTILSAVNTTSSTDMGQSTSDGALRLAAFILLDNNWFRPGQQLAWLHILADTAVYGERARRKLDFWYDSLDRKRDCPEADTGSVAYTATAWQLADDVAITALTQQGCCHRLESRLGVKSGYSWTRSNQLSSDQLSRRQPCFKQGAESVTPQPVVIVLPFDKKALALDNGRLEKLYLPLESGQGRLDRQRAGRNQLPDREQQQQALENNIINRWPDIFDSDLLFDLLYEELNDDVLNSYANYQCQDDQTQREIRRAIKAFHKEYVMPRYQFEASHISLTDILQIKFYQYLYQTTAVEKGNVKILYADSYYSNGLAESGFFQPTTKSQWRTVVSMENSKVTPNSMTINPQLLQGNGRFAHTEVITHQELLLYWREFISSLGDLADLKKLCVNRT